MTTPWYRPCSLLITLALSGVPFRASAQCPNNNTVIAGGAITPPCPGSMTVPCVNGGQYALLNVTAGNIYTFNTCGATYDTQITLYNNAGGGSLATNDDYCGLQSQVTWAANFTGQLRVLVDRYASLFNPCATGGCAPLNISCIPPPPPLTNDNCGSAIALPVLPTCTMLHFTNVGSTASGTAPAPTCSTAPNTDIWFTFTTAANGEVHIETGAITLGDAAMQLYTGTCGALALVPGGCNDDEDFFGGLLMPELDFRCAPLTPFTTYYIRVWGYGGSTGIFNICVSAPATPTTPQEDCAGAFTICNDQQINNNADFTGCTTDLTAANNGCLDGNERQGTWYYFSPSASGTAALTIQPAANIDYDFAIWGPMSTITCPPVGNPIRCSWAYPPNVPGYPGAAAFLTGMGNGAVDASENEFGNGWVAPLNIVAGQIYIMYIDNFDVTGQAFTLDWTLTNGASLDCTVLPVELIGPEADVQADGVHLSWATQSESGSSHFVVERSTDDVDYIPIGERPAAGHSLERIEYGFLDGSPEHGLNYYRLRLLYSDGTAALSSTVAAVVGGDRPYLVVQPNPATDRIIVQLPRSASPVIHYTLRTPDGTCIRQGVVPWNGNDDRLELSLAGTAGGLYMLVLEGADGGPLGSARIVVDPRP
ncbi:MAG: hypothetical protein IPM49_15900 [Flavobacteriales bacterium]|nr:hypothetical protein [Flavobacteriales bacterium]